MKHNHSHSCQCQHASVKFCSHCQTVYCESCNQEWTAKSTYTWGYQPNTWSLGNTIKYAQVGNLGTVPMSTTTCKHGS